MSTLRSIRFSFILVMTERRSRKLVSPARSPIFPLFLRSDFLKFLLFFLLLCYLLATSLLKLIPFLQMSLVKSFQVELLLEDLSISDISQEFLHARVDLVRGCLELLLRSLNHPVLRSQLILLKLLFESLARDFDTSDSLVVLVDLLSVSLGLHH